MSRGEGQRFFRLSVLVKTSEKGTCASASHPAHSRSAACTADAGTTRHNFQGTDTPQRTLAKGDNTCRGSRSTRHTCTGTLESTRSSTLASVSRLRKYSLVNALHSSLDSLDRCAYLAQNEHGVGLAASLCVWHASAVHNHRRWCCASLGAEAPPIARQVHQVPGVVDDKMVDAHCFSCATEQACRVKA